MLYTISQNPLYKNPQGKLRSGLNFRKTCASFVYLVCFYSLDFELLNYNFLVAFASSNFKAICSSPLATSTETVQ